MKKIEAIIRTEKLEEVKNSLSAYGIKGITITQVMGCGMQKGHTEFYRGNPMSINLIKKIKLEIVAKDDDVNEIVEIIVTKAKTGKVGDGKIFIYNVENAIRIRTKEEGENAI